MGDQVLITQDILADEFLPLFVSSVLVLVFGGFYVGIYTAVKVNILKKPFMILGYIFWALTAYCLYLMGHYMHVNDFTAKALMVAGVGLFLIPHAVYYMQNRVHEENEH
ncbi:MAG: hypothetical protein WC144_04260 [Sulfurimonas sp.]|jgi:hypothetical protein|nr:hypothetical protein [Sulfurimonadaceae bacterium]